MMEQCFSLIQGPFSLVAGLYKVVLPSLFKQVLKTTDMKVIIKGNSEAFKYLKKLSNTF